MRLRSRTTLAITGAALALGAGGGGALAAGIGGGPGPPGGETVTAYLGLTETELRTQLQSGETLAQIAVAQGKTAAGLEDAMYAAAKTRLDQAVADGKVTAAQEQTMLAELKSHLDDIVNRSGPPAGVRDHGPRFGSAMTAYLGLTAAELRAQLEAGKTLAQVAVAQGKSVEGLKAAILAGAQTRLDADVNAGRLTAGQEQTRLDELKSHLDDIVNNAGPVAVNKAAPVSLAA